MNTADVLEQYRTANGGSQQRVVSRRWWLWANRAAPLLQIPIAWKFARDGEMMWFGFWCFAIWCNGYAWWGKKSANADVSDRR